jgi:hypothetical protein
MRVIANAILAFVTATGLAFAGYGDKTNGLPNWQERAILVLTNACRMSPVQYRDAYVGAYTILLPENYPAVPPLYWNLALNTSARFHAIQMADTCGMTHNSCNGESFSTRVQKFYKNKSYTIGEDIASGYATPQATMKQWLMDATNNVPAVDLSMCGTARCDGHRANIMSRGYREMGTGYDSGAIQYKYFWCQDFGGGKPEFNNPIVSGVHVFLDAGKTTFMANFFDSIGKPQEASVYIDNQKTAMTLLMGADSAGTYSVALTKGSACRYYYFSFTDSKGKVWRYPETGYLVTQGEGACARDFVPPESLSVRSVLERVVSGNRWIRLSLKCNILTICIKDASKDILQSSIFDASGRLLFTIVWKGNKTSAERTVFDNGMVYRARIDNDIPHGIYFVQNRFVDGTFIPLKLEVAGHD